MTENEKNGWKIGAGAVIGVLLTLIFQYIAGSSPAREAPRIQQAAADYVSHIKPGEYSKAYSQLSQKTQESYTKDQFLTDHEDALWNSRESQIEEVLIDAQDPKKASVKVSGPIPFYNQQPLYLNLVKENKEWKIALEPSLVVKKAPPPVRAPVVAAPTEAPTPPEAEGEEAAPSPGQPEAKPSELCGNGQLDEGEECDPKLPTSCSLGVCKPDCSGCDFSSCGNGVCEADKNENVNNCPTDCHSVCGNGVVEPGEECDGTACNPGQCTSDCTCDSSTCGNGNCEAEFNENCTNCPFDCGECQ